MIKKVLEEIPSINEIKKFLTSSIKKAGKKGYIRAKITLENSSQFSIIKNGILIGDKKFTWDEIFETIDNLVDEQKEGEQMHLDEFINISK